MPILRFIAQLAIREQSFDSEDHMFLIDSTVFLLHSSNDQNYQKEDETVQRAQRQIS